MPTECGMFEKNSCWEMQPVSVFKQTDDKVVYYRVRYSAVDKSSNVQ